MFPYQNRLVRVTDSNDRALEQRSRDGTRLVRFELERYLRSHPATTATYASAGASGATTRIAAPDATATPMTAILDRLVKFRAVRPAGRAGC